MSWDDPSYECDLILKGGITSGIVYPPAIAELAKHHRFRSIGGTSAGAIAAGAAAAAEVGRASRTGGFELLESLPDTLSETDDQGRTRLFRLFQPQPDTRPFFDLVWEARAKTGRARWISVLSGVMRFGPRWMFWLTVAAALAIGIVAVVLGLVVGGAVSLWLSVPLLLVVVALATLAGTLALVVLGGLSLWREGREALRGNFHGFCNGSTPPGSDDRALTDWLDATLQRLAGRDDAGNEPIRDVPVTFGEVAAAGAALVMLTTNLSRGTSEQIPFRDSIWAFDPDELARLFPPEVVRHLVEHAGRTDRAEANEALADKGLVLLPDPEDLPVIVGVRMSLSFPVLLSAVPLYGLTPVRDGDEWKIVFVKNWFSDGGITSNLPVHLFDAPLPSRPTYAINLSGGADPDAAAHENVWRPITSGQGRLPPTEEIRSTLGLLGAVFDTMQNWADNNLSRAAGFRERICTIRLGEGEGGMNLDMKPERIAPLVDRGRCAGRNLASIRTGDIHDSGVPDGPAAGRQWDRHRWTRFRIAGAGVAELIEDAAPSYRAPATPTDESYPDLGLEAAGEGSDLPYQGDWSADRNNDVARAWEAVFGLGGQTPGRFGNGGPADVALSFGASAEPEEVPAKPPRPPDEAARP